MMRMLARPPSDLPTAKPPQVEFDENFSEMVYSDLSFHDVEVPSRPMTGSCDVDEMLNGNSPLVDYFLKATSTRVVDEDSLRSSVNPKHVKRLAAHRDEVRGIKPDGVYSAQAAHAVRSSKRAERSYRRSRAEVAEQLEQSTQMLRSERRKIRQSRRAVLQQGRRAVAQFANEILDKQRGAGETADGLPERQQELPGGVVLESIGGELPPRPGSKSWQGFSKELASEQLADLRPAKPAPGWLVNLRRRKQ